MNISQLFVEQQQLVEYFFANIDHRQIYDLATMIIECLGVIYLTGMGKSGIIAQNISQLLVSIGIRAAFLDPVNALHGDIGAVKKRDIVLFFSKSGQSDELVQLCLPVKARNVATVAIVSNLDSILAQQCRKTVLVPLQRELCPFGMAPTTSTILQLILGNTIVAYIMYHNGLTKTEYAINHPAGRIGKRLTLRVKDLMRKLQDTPICSGEDLLIDTISKMSANQSGFLLVVDNSKLVGIFTDGDLRRVLQKCGNNALEQRMADIMTENPITINSETFAYDAMIEMERLEPEENKKAVKELPVVDSGKLMGVVTLHDLLHAGL